MTDRPPLLGEPILQSFEATLLSTGAPISEMFLPGIDRKKQRKQTKALDLKLPIEAKVWWEWHDGAKTTRQVPFGAYFGPRFYALSVKEATHRYREELKSAKQIAGRESGFLWQRNWFPVASARGAVVCDCSVDADGPTPIRAIDHHGRSNLDVPILPSMGALVELWIEAIEREFWKYDSAAGRWFYGASWPGLPDELSWLV